MSGKEQQLYCGFIWTCFFLQICYYCVWSAKIEDENKDVTEAVPLSAMSNGREENTSVSLKKRRTENLELCDEDKLIGYLTQLQIINPESLVNLATLDEVNILCKKVASSLTTMDDYMKTCKPPNEKDIYMALINGVRTLHEKLCMTNSFKTEFMKYSRCYRDLHQEYGGCVGPKDWAKNQKRIFVCQVYKQLEDCYYNLTLYTCGNNAAENMKQFVEWVTNSVITVDCGLEQNSSERRSTGQNGDISSMDIPAEKSSSANPHLPLYISIGIILLIVIITIIFYVKKWYANRAKSNRAEEEALLRNNS